MPSLELLERFDAFGFPALVLEPSSTRAIAINAAARKVLGVPEGGAWLERLHPHDRPRVERACQSCRPGDTARAVFRVSADDLTFRTVQLELRQRGSPFDCGVGLLTEPIATEATSPPLEALLEALPFDVWERDAEGVLIRQNATALRNWGAGLGSRVEDMNVPPETAKLWRELCDRALAGEVVSIALDHDVAGRRISHTNLIAPVRDGGRIRGVVGVNVDVTQERAARDAAEAAERRSAELVGELSRSLEELALAQSKLVRRERLAALGELAAVVAHEVRNPLAAIYNSLSTLKRQVSADRDAAVLIAILEEEASRLNRTVSDLLSYVRPMQPERRPDDVLELARDVVRQHLEGRPDARAIEAEVASKTELGPVSIDPVLIRIVLSNLVTNAIQAMPQGGRLAITLSDALHENRSAVAIAVRDWGKGIPADVLPRVFEPFFTTRASGAGLGLAVVRRIVEAHDGVVTAESHGDAGTVFTVVLPR